jgi:CheY-like chemotaxis protein
LTDRGWRVRIAGGGDEGLALAAGEPPDVILLDLMMPGGRGGLSTFLELRRNSELESVPVVFVTAYPEPDPGDKHSILGRQQRHRPAAYLEKPVDPETLVATIEEVIDTADESVTDPQ